MTFYTPKTRRDLFRNPRKTVRDLKSLQASLEIAGGREWYYEEAHGSWAVIPSWQRYLWESARLCANMPSLTLPPFPADNSDLTDRRPFSVPGLLQFQPNREGARIGWRQLVLLRRPVGGELDTAMHKLSWLDGRSDAGWVVRNRKALPLFLPFETLCLGKQ